MALIGMVAILLILFVGQLLANKLNQKADTKEMVVDESTLQQLKPNEPPPPPPPPPPKLPPPPPVATVQFTPPKVVKDEEVIKPPPEIKEIEEAKIDIKTQEGVKDEIGRAHV